MLSDILCAPHYTGISLNRSHVFDYYSALAIKVGFIRIWIYGYIELYSHHNIRCNTVISLKYKLCAPVQILSVSQY